MTLQKTDLSREMLNENVYDWILLLSFIVMVPTAFVVAVITKIRHVNHVLGQTGNVQRNAFDRCIVGLETEADVDVLKAFFDATRIEVASMHFAHVLDGTRWTAKTRAGASDCTANKRPDSDTDDEQVILADAEQAAETLLPATAETSAEKTECGEEHLSDSYYDKFTGGFDGTFADMSDYFGGLEKMIGECRKDLMIAMKEEHCEVTDGYGASDEKFVTSSYRVTATPRDEWYFVTAPAAVGEMDAGIDRETGRSRGHRAKVPVEQLLANAAELITKSFADRGFTVAVTQNDVRSIGLRVEEIIALRLYTGKLQHYHPLLRCKCRWNSCLV